MSYLILEWLGRWALPDPDHGGIQPGPYTSEGEALVTLLAYATREYEACLRNVPQEAEIRRERVLAHHKIVACDWPTEGPKD